MARTPTNVTTASTLDGWAIEAHLGVVASHVVAGTGIFSDFAAGFSDLFGGRSGAYQSQLSSLYEEAIGRLHLKGEQLGGNWIVGLHVDIDEISGKGMQMFMVTAIGTAVRAARELADSEILAHPLVGTTAEELSTEMRRRKIERAAAEGTLFPAGESNWTFMTRQRMVTVAPAILRFLGEHWKMSSGVVDKSVWEQPVAFFRNLPPRDARSILYDALS